MALELDDPEHALRPALQREVDLMGIREAVTDIFPLGGLFVAVTSTAYRREEEEGRRVKKKRSEIMAIVFMNGPIFRFLKS